MSGFAALAAVGFALGWSVAWPPGPINAEMIRRGLSRGFWPAWVVGLGASGGDFLWATFVAFGAGAVIGLPGVRLALGAISTLLLLCLGLVFLRGAARAWRAMRVGQAGTGERPLDSTRGGFLLGLTMALSSPWNVAFWIAVIGNAPPSASGFLPSLFLAACVVLGASTWGLVLCGAVHMGARFATPVWDVVTQAVTGLLMLAFAARGLLPLT